jgi:hypothetical protein
VIVPVGLALASFRLGWRLANVGDLLAVLGLMAGVFITAFAVVLSIRILMPSRSQLGAVSSRAAALLDESAVTMLAASFAAGVNAVYLAVITSTTASSSVETVSPAKTSGAVFLGSYVVLYFLLAIRRLHLAYMDTFPPAWRMPRLPTASGPPTRATPSGESSVRGHSRQ